MGSVWEMQDRSMPKINSRNIFSRLPAARKREAFQVLARGKGFRIERIVSCGQATIFIPANTCHRVTWTDPKERTIWLAVHVIKAHTR